MMVFFFQREWHGAMPYTTKIHNLGYILGKSIKWFKDFIYHGYERADIILREHLRQMMRIFSNHFFHLFMYYDDVFGKSLSKDCDFFSKLV